MSPCLRTSHLKENFDYIFVGDFAIKNYSIITKAQNRVKTYLAKRKFRKFIAKQAEIEKLTPPSYFTKEEAQETIKKGENLIGKLIVTESSHQSEKKYSF